MTWPKLRANGLSWMLMGRAYMVEYDGLGERVSTARHGQAVVASSKEEE